MASGSRSGWKRNQEIQIRKLVIQRNRLASKLNKKGASLNAVSIPYIDWHDVSSVILNKVDYDKQVNILNAFINAPKEFANYGAITIAEPLEREIKARVNQNNMRVQKEIEYARKKGDNLAAGGQIKQKLFMGDERIHDHMLTLRDLSSFDNKYNFNQYYERTIRASNRSSSIHTWQNYKDNYIKGVQNMVSSASDEQAVEWGNAMIEKLQGTTLTKFRGEYYGDLLGDINYLQSDEHLKNDAIFEKLAAVSRIFGLEEV